MRGSHRGIVTDEPLECVAEFEQAPGRGGGEVASPQLEHAQAREGQERERRRVAPGPCGDDLERGEEAQDPAELLERAVVAEVGDVRAEVVDGRAGADGLELPQRLEAGGDVVEPDGVQAKRDGAVEQRARVVLREADEQVEVAVAGDRRRRPAPRPRRVHRDRLGFRGGSSPAHRRAAGGKGRTGGWRRGKEEADTAAVVRMIGGRRGVAVP
jgi:hypothetical protein